ncbi:SLC13 family permease, partial [uncultured Deinococcus sp.]
LISPEEAYRSVEWPVIVLVACMLAFGGAFEDTGAAKLLTGALSGVLAPLGPYGLLGGLFAVTVALTQPMSNQAAALVMLPLAIGTAQALGYDPRPFVVGITIAASNSFITPLEPSCMLVYGPGRYTFLDFVRVGLGLTLLTFVVSMLVIPLVWPFQAP